MKMHHLIFLFLICLVGSVFSQSADKDTTNTHGERIDTATERQAFREALDMWTNDNVTLGSLTLGTTLNVDTIYDAAGNTTPLLSLTNGILGEYNPHRLNFNDGTLEVYDGSFFIPSIDYGQYKIYDNTYTELLDWSAGIAFTGTPTLAGDFDISGQVEATGQSADTDDSLMTRSLGDARYARTLTSYKTANEDKTNDATPAQDSTLALTLEANSKYIFEIQLTYQTQVASGHGGFKVNVTEPAGSSIEAVYNIATSASWKYIGRRFTNTTSDIGLIYGQVNAEANVVIKGTIETSSTAGTFAPIWSQNTSNANWTRVLKGSYMIAHKVQ